MRIGLHGSVILLPNWATVCTSSACRLAGKVRAHQAACVSLGCLGPATATKEWREPLSDSSCTLRKDAETCFIGLK